MAKEHEMATSVVDKTKGNPDLFINDCLARA